MFSEPAGGRAVGKTRAFNRAAGRRLDGETVDDGLKLLAMANDRTTLRTVPAGLVIRDFQSLRAGLALDQIDRAAQNVPATDGHRFAAAVRIMPGRFGKAESVLEEPGLPFSIANKFASPDMKIRADHCDFILPDAVDSRR